VTGSAWRLVTGKIVFRIRKIRRRKMPGPETRKASLRRPVFFSVQKKEDVFLVAPLMPKKQRMKIYFLHQVLRGVGLVTHQLDQMIAGQQTVQEF
jgi:hypothetical protein